MHGHLNVKLVKVSGFQTNRRIYPTQATFSSACPVKDKFTTSDTAFVLLFYAETPAAKCKVVYLYPLAIVTVCCLCNNLLLHGTGCFVSNVC